MQKTQASQPPPPMLPDNRPLASGLCCPGTGALAFSLNVRVARALASTVASDWLETDVISVLGGMIALVASAPAIAEAGARGVDDLVGSIVMPDGPPVMANGVNLTAVLRRILDVKEEKPPKVPAYKDGAPAGRAGAVPKKASRRPSFAEFVVRVLGKRTLSVPGMWSTAADLRYEKSRRNAETLARMVKAGRVVLVNGVYSLGGRKNEP